MKSLIYSALLAVLVGVSPAIGQVVAPPVAFTAPVTTMVAGGPTGVIGGDFTGDNITDLVVIDVGNTSFSLIPGAGNRNFGIPRTTNLGLVSPRSVASGDFNGDGTLDLAIFGVPAITPSFVPSIQLFYNNGAGTFTAAPAGLLLPGANGSGGARSLRVADVNGDGNPDLVLTVESLQTCFVYLNNGTSVPFPLAASTVIGGLPAMSRNLVVADVSGDGNADVIIGGGAQVAVALGNGAGAFGPPIVTNFAQVGDGLALPDVNNDGLPDIAHGSTGAIEIALNQGAGVFTPNGALTVPVAPPQPGTGGAAGLLELGTADFNGDGASDLAAATLSTNLLQLFQGTTAAPGFTAVGVAGGGSQNSLTIIDLDGDGALDIASTAAGAVSVFFNQSPVTAYVTQRGQPCGAGFLFVSRLIVGSPVAPTVAVVGANPASAGQTALLYFSPDIVPPSLFLGGPCQVWVNAAYVLATGGQPLMTATVQSNGDAFFPFQPVPNIPSLVGLPFSMQAIIPDATGPAMGFSVTNGMSGQVGF